MGKRAKKYDPAALERYELLYTFSPEASAYMAQLPTFDICQTIARAAYEHFRTAIANYDIGLNHADQSIRFSLIVDGVPFSVGFSPETAPREAWQVLLGNLFNAVHRGQQGGQRRRHECARMTAEFIDALFREPFPFTEIEWAALHAEILRQRPAPDGEPQRAIGRAGESIRFYL